MYWIKGIAIQFLLLAPVSYLMAQNGSGSVRHSVVFGPGIQSGLGMASDFNIEGGSGNMKPGMANAIGFTFNRFLNIGSAVGVTLGYFDSRSSFNSFDSAVLIEKSSRYRINARQLKLALELDKYIDPYGDRVFLGFGISPALNLGTTMERRRPVGTDTAFGYLFPLTSQFSPLSLGGFVKLGLDADIDAKTLFNFNISYSPQYYFRKQGGSEVMHTVMIGVSYYWGN